MVGSRHEVSVKVGMSQVLIDVALGDGAEARDSERAEQRLRASR